ncbi:hypothetical protein [Dokdonella sp.]|uniref:hypothetical protein n=1 Tax=Dokdonella sp. TaxID=2291710 RepID=UPI002F408960
MRTALLLAALATAIATASAADGALDATFGTDAEFPGFGFYLNPYGTGLTAGAQTVRRAPNGQLYLFGSMKDAQDDWRMSIQRLDADGYPDYAFGDFGLRTYQAPCPGAFATDAQIDAQGRLWVGFAGCPDMTIYRFTPAGDLDTSLLGSGVLTIAYDLGDDNEDEVRELAIDAQGGVIVAGFAAATPSRHLAVAHYTSDGAPVPGFGVDGKVDVDVQNVMNAVRGLHLMRDGRIVVTGRYAPNPLAGTQAVVRLQANGAVDAGFGNYAPGIAHADLGQLAGNLDKRVMSEGSLLGADGSVLQVGTSYGYGSAHSYYDIVLVKWKPDGQLDTSIGPFGTRTYALDFAGAAPADDQDNFDRAFALVRQGDGKIVILGESRADAAPIGATLVRLTPSLDLDPTFGDGGKARYLAPIATDGHHCTYAVNPLIEPGRIVAGVQACIGNGAVAQATLGVENDLLFADGLD